MARDIAAILGANSRHDGFYEGQDVCVTWTFGHLCMLKEPADYTDEWRRWAISRLPMLPARFGIKLIDQASIRKQFDVIKTLISKADEVINCGDAGQEGELIQRWRQNAPFRDCGYHRSLTRLYARASAISVRRLTSTIYTMPDYRAPWATGFSA